MLTDDVCRPLFLTDESRGLPDCFVCGNGPDGVSPSEESHRFLATIPLWDDQARRVSIFLPPADDMWEMADRWQASGIEVVVHDPRPRSPGPVAQVCEHSAHGLHWGDEAPDMEQVEPGVLERRHGSKLGGRPSFNRLLNEVDTEYQALEAEGFRFLLQLDWPSVTPDATHMPEGAWPFGDSTFFLALRLAPEVEVRWLWQV